MKLRTALITLLLAVVAMGAATARVPRKEPTPLDNGMAAYYNNQFEQAITWLDKALEQNPENGIAMAYKGAALRQLDQLDQAATLLDRAATLIDDANSTTRAWVHNECFFALIDQADTTAAMQHLELAIRDNDREASYLWNRAVIRAAQGQLDEAIADYDRAVELDPDNTELREARQRAVDHNEKYKAAVSQMASDDTYTEQVITDRDVMVAPQFPGGMDALREHIYKKTGWKAGKSPVSVMVDVTVDTQGNVINAVIKKGYNEKLDKKALDICRKLPTFTPATVNGQPVESTFTVPVRFPKPKK